MPKNIALLTMSLNIGGAETHIFELACELARCGNDVTVFSAGGVYADKLIQNGVKHVIAPLNKKDPVSLYLSYRILRNFVKKNRPDVIHSHTRISNYTANIICKQFGIPLVTTVHFNFKTGFFQKIFSKWGNRAIAVSEDLKTYAAESYGYPREHISVTVNGINLNTFCKRDNPELKAQLGISDNEKVVLCVSRLDEVAGDHVYRVLCMAESIYKNDPDCRIVIVGGGTRYNEFTKKAEGINKKTTDNFIRLVGPQTDIFRFCNIADLFIGISRAALEAMACRVPTILLGNSGYIGLYSKETEAVCIDTNFTCRGCPYPPDEDIIALVHDMLTSPEKYMGLVEDGYQIVKNRYSVMRMADDAMSAYNEAIVAVRPYDVMLCGYYGRHNLGDDMSLEAIEKNLAETCQVKRSVLITTDRKNTPHTEGTLCVHRFDLIKILRLMKKTRLFILGSGSILQDSTSSRSIFYYLYILSKAIQSCPATMLYSNGVGPIKREHYKKRTVKLLDKVDKIMVRDEGSAEYLKKIGTDNKNIFISADETFTLDKAVLSSVYPLEKSKKYLGINLRFLNMSDAFLNEFAQFVKDISKKHGLTPLLIPIHYDQDMPALKRLSARLDCEHTFISQKLAHTQTLSLISQCEVSVLERLHAIIFSCIFDVPFMAINYDPKVMSLCNEFDISNLVISLDNFSKDDAALVFDNLINNFDEIVSNIKLNVDQKRTLAKNNALGAKELLEL